LLRFTILQKICYTNEYCRLEGKKVETSKFPPLKLEQEEKGMQSQVIKTGKPVIIQDAQAQAETTRNAFHVDTDGKLYELDKVPESEEKVTRSGILVPILLTDKVVGVVQVYSLNLNAYGEQELHILQALAVQIGVASNNAKLYEDLQTSNKHLQQAYDKTLEGWSMALQMREKETAGHTRRVAELALKLADRMGISEENKIHLRRGALLHDIGKLVLPDKILHKVGTLTEEEWKIIRNHPVYAYEWLHPIKYLQPALDVPHYHHERWDGSGYPKGLRGNNIPLFARLFAIVDVYDALSSDRPYRDAWPQKKVLDYLRDQAGKQFDPQIVAIFLEMMGN
jgi:putative nucleotidyltransferase with HDIG domain